MVLLSKDRCVGVFAERALIAETLKKCCELTHMSIMFML